MASRTPWVGRSERVASDHLAPELAAECAAVDEATAIRPKDLLLAYALLAPRR
jgi:hypothetical protein